MNILKMHQKYTTRRTLMYRPLPDCLTIKESSIEGLGLFTNENIPDGTELGITHVYKWRIHNNKDVHDLVRTPLGGFINHSIEPNCKLVDCTDSGQKKLETIRNIQEGEELTLKYKLYNPNE